MRSWLGFLILLVCANAGVPSASAQTGLSVGPRGELLLSGTPYRGIGVNYYDLFIRTLAEPPNTNYEAGLAGLAELKIPFVRFSAGGYWPNEWDLYRTNKADYFARFDKVVKSAERHRIGLIPSVFWMSSTVPDLVREPVNRWGETNSRTHGFMVNYTRELVTRYLHSPAIWGWEFGNEYNLPADLPNASDHRPPVVPSLGTPAARSKDDDLTQEMVRTALRAFAQEVRRLDDRRIIISGNAFPRVSAWHQAAEKSWGHDTPEQFAQVLGADNPSPINTLCVRAYDLATDLGRLPQAMAIATSLQKPLFVGEFGVPGVTTETSRNNFTTILQSLETNQVPLAALWVFDFQGQADDWNVSLTNGRAWQLLEIQRANERIRKPTERQ